MPGGGWRNDARRLALGIGCALSVTLGVAILPAAAAGPSTTAPRMSPVGSYPHGYIEFTAGPGALLSATVLLQNPSSQPATFEVTAVDGYTSPASGVVYGNRQTPFRDGPTGNGEFGAGTWITLDASEVHLNPGQSVTVHARIAVPLGTHPGDWVGGIIAENPVAAGGSGAVVRVESATAIAIVVHVPGPVSLGAIFLDKPTVRVAGGQQLLDIPLRYTGDVLVKPFFSFAIRDSSGRVVYQHQGRFDTFMPHTTIVYEVVLEQVLQPGSYTFTGTIGPAGNEQTFSYRLQVGSVPPVPSSGGGQGQGGSGALAGRWPAWLWAVIAILSILLVLVLLALTLARRCTHCGRPRPWGLMPVGEYQEIANCRECRAAARERRSVVLCPACYRSHVLPVTRGAAPAH